MQGYVYILGISTLGWYKIGRTANPNQGWAHLSALLPFDIHLVALFKAADCVALEKLLHAQFAASRIRGEWFALSRAKIWALIFQQMPKACRVEVSKTYFEGLDFTKPGKPTERGKKPKTEWTSQNEAKFAAIARRIMRTTHSSPNVVSLTSAGNVMPVSSAPGSCTAQLEEQTNTIAG